MSNAAAVRYDRSYVLEEQDALTCFLCAPKALRDVAKDAAAKAFAAVNALPVRPHESAVIFFKRLSMTRRMGRDQDFTVDLTDTGPRA